METEASKDEHAEKFESTVENRFEDVYKYRFHENVKFVEGWSKVKDVIAKEKQYESLIKAQVYFYSREVGLVDLDGYKNWLKENDKEIQEFDSYISNDGATKPEENIEEEVGNKNENSTNTVSVTSAVEVESGESLKQEDNLGRHPANFIELIEMIQSGMKLPDTEDLNIEPLNVDPTPCEIQRPKKPWEVG